VGVIFLAVLQASKIRTTASSNRAAAIMPTTERPCCRNSSARPQTMMTFINLNLLVYLDSEVQLVVGQIACSQRSDVSHVVKQLRKSNMKLAQAMQ
jgi:hypothetical protein